MIQPVPQSIQRLPMESSRGVAIPAAIEIVWSDAVRRVYTPRLLRDACPCANCREQRTSPPQLPALLAVLTAEEVAPLAITAMKPVGQYAYSIEFSDGHSTGIYTLDLLHALGE